MNPHEFALLQHKTANVSVQDPSGEKITRLARTGIEPATLALLAPRSNQLS